MDEGVLGTIGTVSIYVAAVVSTVFVISYTVLARWWTSESGWHIFSFMFVLAFILDHSALSLWLGSYLFRDWIRAIMFPVLAGVMIWRLYILWRVQITKRVKREEYDVRKPR